MEKWCFIYFLDQPNYVETNLLQLVPPLTPADLHLGKSWNNGGRFNAWIDQYVPILNDSNPKTDRTVRQPGKLGGIIKLPSFCCMAFLKASDWDGFTIYYTKPYGFVWAEIYITKIYKGMIVPILSPSDPHLNTRDGDKVSIGKLTLEAVQEVLDRSNIEIGYEHLKSQCFSLVPTPLLLLKIIKYLKAPCWFKHLGRRKHIDLVWFGCRMM